MKSMFRILALSTTCLLFAVGNSHAVCYWRAWSRRAVDPRRP